MTNEEAVNELRNIRGRISRAMASVSRKRSWRDSEKAMTVSSYRLEIEAIDYAVSMLSTPKTLGELDKSEPGWDHFDTTPIDPTALAAGRPLVTKTRR